MGNPFMKLILVNKNGKIEKILILHRQFSKFCKKKSGENWENCLAIGTKITEKPSNISKTPKDYKQNFICTKSLGNGLSENVCHCLEAFGV